MLQQDHLTRIVNVTWGGAVKFENNAYISQAASPAPHTQALTISGWVKVPDSELKEGEIIVNGTNYVIMTFGDMPGDIGVMTEIRVAVAANGTFGLAFTFIGNPFGSGVDSDVPFYGEHDGFGWFAQPDAPGDPMFPVAPGMGIFSGYCAGGPTGFISPPILYGTVQEGNVIQGCRLVPFEDTLLGQRLRVNQNLGLVPRLARDQWHHFLISVDTGGQSPFAGNPCAAFLFINGQSAIDYLEGQEGMVSADAPMGVGPWTETGPGSMFAINGLRNALGNDSKWLVQSGGMTPIHWCDWQFYPRLINPNTEISNFIRIENGVRKRVSTRVAEDAYGVPVGSPPIKRPLWLFKGGGGSFHKSGPRSTDGEFVKIGVIKTVPPPPMWSPPA